MQARDQHIIRKAKIRLQYSGGQTDPFILRNETERWSHEELLPRLEQVLSVFTTDDVLVIDSLKINVTLGNAGKNWEEEVLSKVESEFLEKIRSQQMLASAGKGMPVSGHPPRKGSTISHLIPGPGSFAEKMAFYLLNGYLPWNSLLTGKKDLEEEVAVFLDGKPGDPVLRPLLDALKNAQARERMNREFGDQLWKSIISAIYHVPVKDLDDLLYDADQIIPKFREELRVPGLKLPSRIAIRSYLVEKLAGEKEGILSAFESAVRSFLYDLKDLRETGIKKQDLKVILHSPPVFRSAAFTKTWHDVFRDLTKKEGKKAVQLPVFPEDASGGIPGISPVTREKPKDTPEKDLYDEGIYINNAGLILVAPFIPVLFGRLGIAEGTILKEPGQGLVLLHYLVSGNDNPAEFELVLPKILCGMEIRRNCIFPGFIPVEWKKEADEMLASAIEHWSVLKNTTAEGLREAFLQRSGKLSFVPGSGDWLLIPEQKAYDMLIGQIPWNFRFIRFQWMNCIVRTEWVGI